MIISVSKDHEDSLQKPTSLPHTLHTLKLQLLIYKLLSSATLIEGHDSALFQSSRIGSDSGIGSM